MRYIRMTTRWIWHRILGVLRGMWEAVPLCTLIGALKYYTLVEEPDNIDLVMTVFIVGLSMKWIMSNMIDEVIRTLSKESVRRLKIAINLYGRGQ